LQSTNYKKAFKLLQPPVNLTKEADYNMSFESTQLYILCCMCLVTNQRVYKLPLKVYIVLCLVTNQSDYKMPSKQVFVL